LSKASPRDSQSIQIRVEAVVPDKHSRVQNVSLCFTSRSGKTAIDVVLTALRVSSLQNDLLCVEWVVRFCSCTHSLTTNDVAPCARLACSLL